jgi:glycosyltransferase involved in cell wall biosynthesis
VVTLIPLNLKSSNHLISIIVPTRNRLEYLKVTIKSLEHQTYKNFEIIVVDDNSIDKTWDYLLSCQSETFKILKLEKNLGESMAINAGYNLAKGDYISVISDDDPQESTWISDMFSFISDNPGFIFYYPNIRVVDEFGVVVEDIFLQDWTKTLQLIQMKCLASSGSILNFLEFAKPISLRDDHVTYPSDLIMYNNLSRYGHGARVPNVFGIWRSHANNLTYSKNSEDRAIEFILNCDKWIHDNRNQYNLLTFRIAKFFVRLQAVYMIKSGYGNNAYLLRFIVNSQLSYKFIPFRFCFISLYLYSKNKSKFNLHNRLKPITRRLKRFLQK